MAKNETVYEDGRYSLGKKDGLLVIPEKDVPEFKRLLVACYEDRDSGEIVEFMKDKCWKRMDI